MLVNSKKILKKAQESNSVIFQFNINNLEFAKYIIEKANEMHKPIIIGVSEGAIKYMGGYNTVVNMIKGLIKDEDITIDIVLHLDHGRTIECCEKAIEVGFTSVMYDGSKLPIDENIKNTNIVIEKCKSKKISIEGELGALGTNSNIVSYTNIKDAIEYVQQTNIDSLAVAVGNVHGLYKGKPKINTSLIKKISMKTQKPLVLHGGSGISKEVFETAIKNGICKININTEFQIVWTKAVKKYIRTNRKEYDPRKIIGSGEQSIKDLVEYYLTISK